jgi:hypothetical protein
MEKDAIFLFDMFWCMRDCFVWVSVEMQLFGNVLVQERVDVDREICNLFVCWGVWMKLIQNALVYAKA